MFGGRGKDRHALLGGRIEALLQAILDKRCRNVGEHRKDPEAVNASLFARERPGTFRQVISQPSALERALADLTRIQGGQAMTEQGEESRMGAMPKSRHALGAAEPLHAFLQKGI